MTAARVDRARIVNENQGPEYGDASACLKNTYSGDPARPVGHIFKMRAPADRAEFQRNSLDVGHARHLQAAHQMGVEFRSTSRGDTWCIEPSLARSAQRKSRDIANFRKAPAV